MRSERLLATVVVAGILVGLAVPAAGQLTGTKDLQLVTNSGATVKIYPLKEGKVQGLLGEGVVTDEEPIFRLTAEKGNAIAYEKMIKGGGLRIDISHPDFEPESFKVPANEIAGLTLVDLEFYLRKRIVKKSAYAFDSAKVWHGGRCSKSETKLTCADPETLEKVTFEILSTPPAEIATLGEFKVAARAEISNAKWDYMLKVCWECEDFSKCTAAWSGGSQVIGRNSESGEVIPSTTGEFTVTVPEMTCEAPELSMRVIWGMGIEANGIDWLEWYFKKK